MRCIITAFISLDGVTQAPGGAEEDTDGGFAHGGWSAPFFDPETMGGAWDEMARRGDALLQGRRTYTVSAQAWAPQSGDPFADWINRVQKYVVSDTLTEADATWDPTEIIRGADLEKKVAELREQPGGDIVVMGSSQVARSLLSADLVDGLTLMIEPIVLGGGKSIYPTDGLARTFELTDVATSPTGVQICKYTRAR
ncbi:MAG TPA: dihydrofolate reductase family protein [Acidimicrobiales bacterium]